jgi:Glycosyl transferase family 2
MKPSSRSGAQFSNRLDSSPKLGRPDATPEDSPAIGVVVLLFDEEDNLAELRRRLNGVLGGLRLPFEVLFVNDGSRDATASLIDGFQAEDAHLTLMPFSITRLHAGGRACAR